MVVPWLVIRKVRDDLGAFMAGAVEGGHISASTEGFCGHSEDPEGAELGRGGWSRDPVTRPTPALRHLASLQS